MFLISGHHIILQHIKVLDLGKLEILSPETDKSKIHFHLHSLKNLLPTVIVKVKLLWFKDSAGLFFIFSHLVGYYEFMVDRV